MTITIQEFCYSNPASPISLLPDEMLAETFSHLNDPKEDKENIINCTRVCKKWNRVIWEHSNCNSRIICSFPKDFKLLNTLAHEFDQMAPICGQHAEIDYQIRVSKKFNQLSKETQNKLNSRLLRAQENEISKICKKYSMISGNCYKECQLITNEDSLFNSSNHRDSSPHCKIRKELIQAKIEEEQLSIIARSLMKFPMGRDRLRIICQFAQLPKQIQDGVHQHLKALARMHKLFQDHIGLICFNNTKIPDKVKIMAINAYLRDLKQEVLKQ